MDERGSQHRPSRGGDKDGSEPRRKGRFEEEGSPPLDWRLTPRNVILQIAAAALFIGVMWFLWELMTDGFSVLLR